MKKTLIAVAALSAMAASAMAANVTVSGVVDLGLNFKNVKTIKGDTDRTFTMNSGQNSGSRVMFKGSEDLGNGVEVGFQLESGFKADDGTLGATNNIFQRESRLYVKTAFGTLHAGRFGVMDAGTGSLSIFGGSDLCAFGTGLGDTIGKESTILEGLSSRLDNTIAYQSPTFAGMTLYLAHSFKGDNADKYDGTEGRPSATQYNGVGLKYVNGPFNAALVASQKNYRNEVSNVKNSKAFSFGAGYNFGVCKVMAEGQYFNMGRVAKGTSILDNTLKETKTYSADPKNKGWGTIVSVTAPVAGGMVLASVGYKDAKNIDNTDLKNKVWNAGLEYTYSFSKRTMFYVGAGYTENKTEGYTGDDAAKKNGKIKTTEVVTGLVHKF